MAKQWAYEDIKDFLEGGYSTRPEEFNGVVRHNCANESVDMDFDLVYPVVTLAHLQAFHASVLKQMESQTVAGKRNVIIFQCDSRSPGTANSGNKELEKSFMFFHSYNKCRGKSLGPFLGSICCLCYGEVQVSMNSDLLAFQRR